MAGGEARENPRVGVLLPLTGAYAEAADAVLNGFIAAHFQGDADLAIRVHDTATPAGATAAYRQALAEGADIVVGPLTKTSVRELGSAADGRVPVVALNYADGVARGGFYQLGLAPEDEAREAARSAFREGARGAIILVPGDGWGRRIADAFSEEFVALGGLVREQATFDGEAYDLSPTIARVLGIAESEARHRAMTRIIGTRSAFEPRRRDDFDVVFIAATAQMTRLLVPQLRFHYLGDIPVYGTANAHDGTLQFHHRDGLRFCGSPIVLDEAGTHAELRQALSASFHPGNLDSLRLLALGHDAYQFARLTLESNVEAGRTINGATGTLIPGADGAIHRRLSCVEISRNQLVPLPGAAPP